MKLSYRGNDYQSETSLLEIRETDIGGKYRGHHWRQKLPQHIPQLRPKLYLQYRGVAYSTCPRVKVATEQTESVSFNTITKSPQLSTKNTEKVHLENLRRNLIRRLQQAQDNGNENLVSMLKQESQALHLQIECVGGHCFSKS